MGLLRVNNLGDATGTVNPITLTSGSATSCSWTTAPVNMPAVVAPDYVKLVVAPNTTAEEIIYVTAYTAAATTATVLRAQEGTTGATHTAVAWINGATARDLTTTPTKVVTSAYQILAADGTLLVTGDVSLVDSGPNGSTLTSTAGEGTVPSPVGTAFSQGVQFNGGVLVGPTGTAAADGAITGSAFTAEFWYTPTAADIAGADTFVINRSGEWEFLLESGSATPAVAGVGVGSQPVLVAGKTYHIALTWNGTTWTFWLNGVSYGTTTTAKPTATSQALVIGAANTGITDPTTGIVDEVRISNTCRYTTGFTPPTAPFTSDGNTSMLYHFDGGVTLPAPATVGAGSTYHVKSTGSPFCLKPNAAETIDGGAAPVYGGAYGALELVTDGTNWSILSPGGVAGALPTELGYAQVTANVSQTGGTQNPVGMPAVSVFCPGGPIRVEFFCAELGISALGDNGNVYLNMDGSGINGGTVESSTGATSSPATIVARVSPAAGWHTFTSAVASSAGTVTAYAGAAYPMWLRVTR